MDAGHHSTATQVPALPVATVRDAIAREDWTEADRLLAAHEEMVEDALSVLDQQSFESAPWLQLLAEQAALLNELRSARDAAAEALARCQQGRRGADAWLREMA